MSIIDDPALAEERYASHVPRPKALGASRDARQDKIRVLTALNERGWHSVGFVDRRRYALTPPEAPRIRLNVLIPSRSNTLDAKFNELAEKWRDETLLASSGTEIILNENYQRIIGMGPKVVPLILRSLERRLDHWSWALTAITGEQPAVADPGNLQSSADAWLRWGRSKGLI